MEDQIIEFLASGLSRQETLDTVGCSTELFQEMLAKPEFTAKLTARAKELTKERIDYRYTQLEDKVLKHVTTHIDEYDANGLCKILETASKQRLLKDQGANHFQNPTAGNNQVILILPQQMSEMKVIKNDRNEVVAINNRNMGSLPIDGVKELFSKFTVQPSIQATKGEDYETITGERTGNEAQSVA